MVVTTMMMNDDTCKIFYDIDDENDNDDAVLFIKDAVKAGNYISHRPDNIPFMAFIQAKCSQTLLYFKRRTFCKTITTLTLCHLCNLGNATHRA